MVILHGQGNTSVARMDVYVINMPQRTDRRNAMELLIGRLGISMQDVRFVEPVAVSHVPNEYASHGMTTGYMSLNMTVRDKVFDMAARGTDVFLVFEDDAMERVHAEDIMPRVYEMLHDLNGVQWDVVYLEYCLEHCASAPDQRVGQWLQRASSPYCTAATLYNRTSIERIRRCLDVRKKLIDFSYVECIKDNELVAYIAMPALFAQDTIYGAGDLAHLSPVKVQWWLNLVLRMYPENDDLQHGPRLPACLGRELIGYVRWGNIALMVATLAVMGVLFHRIHRKWNEHD